MNVSISLAFIFGCVSLVTPLLTAYLSKKYKDVPFNIFDDDNKDEIKYTLEERMRH